MTEAAMRQWETSRARGRARFIAVEGVLRRGILSAVILAAFVFQLAGSLHLYSATLVQFAATTVILSLLFGIGLGAMIWRINERDYEKSALRYAKA